MLLNCGVGEDSGSPLDCKEIKPVHPKGNQSWMFIGRTDIEAETLILWPPDVKNWLIGKTLMLGKIEGRRKGRQRTRWLDGITNLMDLSLSRCWSWWWTGKPGVLQSMGSQRVRHDWGTELNWVKETGRPYWGPRKAVQKSTRWILKVNDITQVSLLFKKKLETLPKRKVVFYRALCVTVYFLHKCRFSQDDYFKV